MEPSIKQLAEQWLELDHNEATRAEIQKLLDEGDTTELELRLRHRIAFGTAGLRARMSAGFSRMNKLTVIQASQGLCAYMLQSGTSKGVVVGHDARHNSLDFARATAAVFLLQGFTVYWLGQCHTPLVPFSVGKYSAGAGVMVTASHNPKQDNGYKVYWSNGCQMIPPHDQNIARSIEANLTPANDIWKVEPTALDSNWEDRLRHVRDEAEQQYVEKVMHAARWSKDQTSGSRNYTYTPMHGVGLAIFLRLCDRAGMTSYIDVVGSQALPDPEFSTVSFPNPEEKGALDEAKKAASASGNKLIIANDPDADRFTAAELVDGKWVQFTGNQLGVLFGSYALEQYESVSGGRDGSKAYMLASAVSSRMLGHMARATGKFHFEETLTGFKWLGNKTQDLERAGSKPLYAYEEAIGYMFPEVVYDKDGIAAAAVFISAVRKWAAEGMTPWQRLQRLYQEFGYFEEANTYLVSPSPEVTAKVFDAIREAAPKNVGSHGIKRWRDLTVGHDSATADHVPVLPVDPSAQMITCELEGDVVFTVRGSGTEPKIKLYIEGRAETAVAAKSAAEGTLKALLDEWFMPETYGLRLA